MLLAHGVVLRTMHKRVLQIVAQLKDLVPTIMLKNNGSKNSVAEPISIATAEKYCSGHSVIYPSSVHERRVQYTAVQSKKITSNIFLCVGIHLVGNMFILIRLNPFFTQSGEHVRLLQTQPP